MKKEHVVSGPLCLTLTWKGAQLERIDLEWAGERTSSSDLSDYGRALGISLERFVQGQDPDWPVTDLDFSSLTPFSRRVLQELQTGVGWGEVTTYGQLAKRCGSPRGARAVGMAMNRNPWPLLIPCHRVVGSDRSLTGFGSGIAMKKYLLEKEGSWPVKTSG